MDFSNIENTLSSILVRPRIELVHGIIDDITLVSKKFYKQKGWKLALFDQYLTYMQVDLFVQALNKLNINKVKTFLHTWEDIRHFKSVKSEYQSIKDIFYNVGAADKDWNSPDVVVTSIVVTNESLDFIVFIDEYRESYYFYGNKEFVDTLMPVSCQAYKDFFKSNYEILKYNAIAIDYLEWLWKHYIDSQEI